jgi:hypothetical protein
MVLNTKRQAFLASFVSHLFDCSYSLLLRQFVDIAMPVLLEWKTGRETPHGAAVAALVPLS